jgi:HAD superfamily hydrolase (TIGR01509 family)
MQKPEAVVFDLGKVLVDFDYGIAVNRVAARCDVNGCDLWQVFTPAAKLLLDYETGLLTTEEFFDHVQKTAGFLGNLTEFTRLFSDIFVPIEPMIALNERLRSKGIPTYIFSNTNPLAVNHIRERFPFFQNFTAYVLSYEHRSMKPDSRIYDVVEQATGKNGGDILYIDDRPENIAAGAERGWQTILQETPEKTLGKVSALGMG